MLKTENWEKSNIIRNLPISGNTNCKLKKIAIKLQKKHQSDTSFGTAFILTLLFVCLAAFLQRQNQKGGVKILAKH